MGGERTLTVPPNASTPGISDHPHPPPPLLHATSLSQHSPPLDNVTISLSLETLLASSNWSASSTTRWTRRNRPSRITNCARSHAWRRGGSGGLSGGCGRLPFSGALRSSSAFCGSEARGRHPGASAAAVLLSRQAWARWRRHQVLGTCIELEVRGVEVLSILATPGRSTTSSLSRGSQVRTSLIFSVRRTLTLIGIIPRPQTFASSSF